MKRKLTQQEMSVLANAYERICNIRRWVEPNNDRMAFTRDQLDQVLAALKRVLDHAKTEGW